MEKATVQRDLRDLLLTVAKAATKGAYNAARDLGADEATAQKAAREQARKAVEEALEAAGTAPSLRSRQLQTTGRSDASSLVRHARPPARTNPGYCLLHHGLLCFATTLLCNKISDKLGPPAP